MKKLIGIILMVCSTGCKDTHCPAFPHSLLDYFPYSKGEELRFDNDNGDTLLLVVTNSWASDAYSFEWNCKCACGAGAGFKTDISSNYSLRIDGELTLGENHFEVVCYFYDSVIHHDVFSYFKEGFNPFNAEQQLTLPDTIFIEKQIYNRIGKMKIIRSKGIVEFWDKEQNCNWVRIET